MDYTLDDVLAKAKEIEVRQNEILKAEAEVREQKEKKEERNNSFYKNNIRGNSMENIEKRNVGAELLEKRAVVVGNTGKINQETDLVHLVKNKRDLLGKVRFYQGKDKNTVIPVVGVGPSVPVGVTEGQTGISYTQTLALSTETVTPAADFALLPITDYMLKFSVVDEGELVSIFAESFGDKWNAEIGSNTNTGRCKGIFHTSAVDSANTTTTASGYPTLQEMYEFAGDIKKLDANYELYTSTEVVSALMAEQTNDYNFIKEELAQKGTIRGLKVVETVFTSTGAQGEMVVVASDLSKNYAIGLPYDVEIKSFEEKDSMETVYKGVAYVDGKVIQPKNNFGIVCGA